MRRVGAAFFLGDTAFLSDPKFRKLARRLSDPDDFNSAVGAYWIALAAARRNGHRTIDLDTETGSKFLDVLREVGLLEEDGFRSEPFDAWAPSSPQQVIAGRVRASKGERDENGRFLPAESSDTSALDVLDESNVENQRAGPPRPASTPIKSFQVSSTEGRGVGEETDDLWALYAGLTRTPARKPATLDWLERIETTYGLGPSAKALREEHAKDSNPGTLLSRTSARLEDVARRVEKDTAADKRSEGIQARVRARAVEKYRFTGQWDEALYGPPPAVELVP